MKKRLLFIDDDGEFEVPLFKEVFGDEFDIIAGTAFADVLAQLEDRKEWSPDLVVLDMYFPSDPPDKNAIREIAKTVLPLQPDRGQIRQAFLNHLAAANRLRQVLAAWNQSADGGRRLAASVAQEFPTSPIVFYSRKATLQDAVKCMMVKNVVNVVLKPSAKNDEQTKELTRTESSRIAAEFKNAMRLSKSRNLAAVKKGLRVIIKWLCEFFTESDRTLK